jgi:hypothetical protein
MLLELVDVMLLELVDIDGTDDVVLLTSVIFEKLFLILF